MCIEVAVIYAKNLLREGFYVYETGDLATWANNESNVIYINRSHLRMYMA